MKIAFIGLGRMGAPICGHLLAAGHSLHAHDLSAAALDRVAGLGAIPHHSVAAAVTGADVIFTSLPNPEDVQSVALEPDGIVAHAAAGTIHIDLSTNDPVTVRSIGAEYTTRGLQLLDAPVSGGIYGAERGQLSIMVGGDPEVFERVHGLLDCFARTLSHVGPLGCGSIAKLINNLVAFNNAATAAEALMLGAAAGIAPETLDTVIRSSSGDSVMYRSAARKILRGDWAAQFTVDLATKDLTLATAMASDLKVPLMLGTQTHQLLRLAQAMGFGQDDLAGIAQVYERMLERTIRSDDAP